MLWFCRVLYRKCECTSVFTSYSYSRYIYSCVELLVVGLMSTGVVRFGDLPLLPEEDESDDDDFDESQGTEASEWAVTVAILVHTLFDTLVET